MDGRRNANRLTKAFAEWGLNRAHVCNRMLGKILLAVSLMAEASKLTVAASSPHSEKDALLCPEDKGLLEVNKWMTVQWPSLYTGELIGVLPRISRENQRASRNHLEVG